MKATSATLKIKEFKDYYNTKLIVISILIFLFFICILFFYWTSAYTSLPWANFICSTFKIFFPQDNKLMLFILISLSIVCVLLNGFFVLLTYLIYNKKYQKEYLNAIFNELNLNEIYLEEKKKVIEERRFELIYQSINLSNRLNRIYLFSLRGLLMMDFYQIENSVFSFKKKGVLITSSLIHPFDGYLQFRFDECNEVEMYEGKMINQFPYELFKNSKCYMFINSSFGKYTNDVVDDNIINLLKELKKYTKTNFVFTISNYDLNIYIDNWELRLQESLRKKLDADAIDKKVEALTELIDYIADIYIYINRNIREVTKYDK
ncbi:MAG: hypothetical protein PUA56_04910 [Bacillales bacterium]|nr:hypothetical protein [Bacillales bacterium]